MTNTQTLSDRAVLRLSGEARRSFLQGLITQDIERLTPTTAIFAALLTPQGKILFDFFVCETGEEFLIDCHRDSADMLLKRLTLYKLRAKVSIERAEDLHVSAGHNEPAGTTDVSFEDPRLAALGWRVISAVASDVSVQAYRDHRIAQGVPECGSDFGSDEMFLLDVNYDSLAGVSYKKGCFVGQEVTSRMKRKGEVRKRTLIVSFSGEPPAVGSPVTAGESTLGTLLSVADSQALALIRLDRWEAAKAAGADIQCESTTLQLTLPAYLETV